MNKELFFFIGTEAELIKLFPIMLECQKRNVRYHIIVSGQNDIVNSQILKKSNCGEVELELSKEEDIRKNVLGLFKWFLHTYKLSVGKIRSYYGKLNYKGSYIIVHGDTVSTLMGALIGGKLGMYVCHVEAGLRSHNIINPFPEEIDRILTSRKADIHFAPGNEPCRNLKNTKGDIVNTKLNTIIDSLQYSFSVPVESRECHYLNQDYFVFVMHRQENLVNKIFVKGVLKQIIEISKDKKCVLILHQITRDTFEKYGILNVLELNPNFILQPRMNYFDFMKVLESSKFVITDGGSNQEELFYMGKPCLIIRKTTERNEGLGKNAELFNNDVSMIKKFAKSYDKRKTNKVIPEMSPSIIIVDRLMGKNKLG